jgi:hypothetical protein
MYVWFRFFNKEWMPSNVKTKGVIMKCKVMLLVAVFFSVISMNVFAYSGGTGTAIDPYLISNKADLFQLDSTIDDYDKSFKMTADIDLAGTNFTHAIIGALGHENTRSGYEGYYFTGVFDGDRHAIKNMTISAGAGETDNFGLFCAIQNAEIKDLTIENCTFNGSSSLGAITGYALNPTVTGCSSTGSISGTGGSIGGILGWVESGIISNCYSKCNVSSTSSYTIGGLMGVSINTTASVFDSYSCGVVESGSTGGGGFVGYAPNVDCVNCFWDTEASGVSSSVSGAIGKTTVEMKTQSTFTDWNFDTIWTMNGYPKLQWEKAKGTFFIL